MKKLILSMVVLVSCALMWTACEQETQMNEVSGDADAFWGGGSAEIGYDHTFLRGTGVDGEYSGFGDVLSFRFLNTPEERTTFRYHGYGKDLEGSFALTAIDFFDADGRSVHTVWRWSRDFEFEATLDEAEYTVVVQPILPVCFDCRFQLSASGGACKTNGDCYGGETCVPEADGSMTCQPPLCSVVETVEDEEATGVIFAKNFAAGSFSEAVEWDGNGTDSGFGPAEVLLGRCIDNVDPDCPEAEQDYCVADLIGGDVVGGMCEVKNWVLEAAGEKDARFGAYTTAPCEQL